MGDLINISSTTEDCNLEPGITDENDAPPVKCPIQLNTVLQALEDDEDGDGGLRNTGNVNRET